MKYWLVVIIMICSVYGCLGQQIDSGNFSFQHLTIEDGLSQNLVESVQQDLQGFMWFGTEDGLNRYDGYEFRTYKNDPNDSLSISGNQVKDILETKDGELWVVAGGLNKYDRSRDVFENIEIETQGDPEFSPEDIEAICEDKNGDIWVAINDLGLYRIKRHEKTENHGNSKLMFNFVGPYANFHGKQQSLQGNLILDVLVDNDNNLWIGTRSGLYLLSPDSNGVFPNPNLTEFKKMKSQSHSEEMAYHSIFVDQNNQVWIGTNRGLMQCHLINSDQFDFELHQYPKGLFDGHWKGTINTIEESISGDLWLGTYDGIVIFDPNAGTFNKIVSNPKISSSLSLGNVRHIFRDRGNIIWIGTGGMGVDKYVIPDKLFHHYLDKSDFGSIFSTYSVLEDRNGIIWLATSSGEAFKFNPLKKEVSSISLDESLEQNITDMIFEGENKIVFVANNYAYSYDVEKDRIWNKTKIWESDQIFDPPDSITVVYRDHEEQIWFCNSKNLISFNRNFQPDKKYRILFDNLNKVNSLFRDQNGIFWIGTTNGMVRFDIETGQQSHITCSDLLNLPKITNQINDIEPDPNPQSDDLWLATGGSGILSMNKKTMEVSHYSVKNGLTNDFVYCILFDKAGNLWASTNRGISKIDRAKNKISKYSVNDGLQSNEFNRYAKYQSASGKHFFGGINGITAFFPSEIKFNANVPNVVLTDFKINYESVNQNDSGSPLKMAINVIDEIELNYDQNDVSFTFSALDFTQPEQNKYQFKLENFDRNWIDIGTNRQASYTNLPPGTYKFEFKGSNNDSVWNQEGNSIRLVINPPPWKTWWAYILYSVLVLTIVSVVNNFRYQRIKLKEQLRDEKMELQQRAELDEFKSEFFAGISHELRTPLTLILGRLEKLMSDSNSDLEKKQLSSIKEHSSELIALVDQILDLSRIESGILQPIYEYLDIVNFVRSVVVALVPIAEKKSISLLFTSDFQELHMDVDTSVLKKILQNLVLNAIKFSNQDQPVKITLDLIEANDSSGTKHQAKTLRIRVIDNGIGIDKENLDQIFNLYFRAAHESDLNSKGFGIGLSLSMKLTELLGGKISATSEIGEGTVFTVDLPVKNDYMEAAVSIPETKSGQGSYLELEDDRFQSKEAENTILLVEDHHELQSFLVEILEKDYEVIVASNGEEGCQSAFEHIPDLIVSDVMMPNMNGFEFAKIIRGDIRTNHIPFLFLTAKIEDKDRLKALDLGINEYLTKPFESRDLKLRIRNLLSLRDNIKYKAEDGKRISETTENRPEFISKLIDIISANVENEQLSVEFLCDLIGISRSQLNRKLRGMSELSAVQLIQEVRLATAHDLLQRGFRVSEAALRVGYNSPAHFSKIFKEKFGYSPKSVG